ncbi:MAG TPA: phytoene/squalene synthase family protein [Thermoanaerobaculia bacterium]|nr:phytoene/squalene synthase family protein [Thermoanaerobaculia bacterium]
MTSSETAYPIDSTSSPSVDEAYRFCRSIAHKHGANFSVGFRFLPDAKRKAVYAAYAWCRWADDIADEPGTEIPERLSAWQDELENCYKGHPTHIITIALADALKRFDIPKDAFIALIDGCRQDLTKNRYETFDELVVYCDYVATSISDISLAIFGYRTERALEYGRNLATALQLTNITRDIGDDLQRDRIYIPAEELERFSVLEDDLRSRKRSEPVLGLIEFQIARAESYFRNAEPLLGELDFDARFPVQLMGGVYAAVLRKLRADPFAALGERISLSRFQKLSVILTRSMRKTFV